MVAPSRENKILLAALVVYACFAIVTIALAGNMNDTAFAGWTNCLNQYNVAHPECGPNTTTLPANVTRPPVTANCTTPAIVACGILWVWGPGCAVAITAGALALAGAIVGVIWTVIPLSSVFTDNLFRVGTVFFLVSAIIFGGIAGILLSLSAREIVIANGYSGVALPYYVQTAVCASFAFVVMAYSFLMCTPASAVENDYRYQQY